MSSRPAAAVLGSAFSIGAHPEPALGRLVPDTVRTAWGEVSLFRHVETDGVVLFRHGLPHCYLPHQIPWRAQAAALKALDVRAVLLTSSVGVLDPTVPLYVPHLAADLVMPDNRLPDGSMCTMWP
jgi:5'-methylthioadenosine phosphorylase